ncbi:MAG: DUF4845 domain-containing protein [Pseudomonadales bacterium]
MNSTKPTSVIMRRQTGAIDMIVIFAIMFGVVAIVAGIKIMPVYIDHWSIEEALTDVVNEAASEGKPTKKSLQRKMGRRMQVNRLEFITTDDLKFERTKTTLTGSIDYERRVPLIFNMDIVVKFPETVAEAALSSE